MDASSNDWRVFSREDENVHATEVLMQQLAGDDVLGHMVVEHLAGGGKRLRARLALAAVRALGGVSEHAIGWAAACEMMHNATLVHDDLQDGDRIRRGHPTVWAAHGMAQAVNAGDLMLVLPALALDGLNVPATVRWQLCRALATRIVAVVRGQAQEYALRQAWNMDREAYLSAVRGKTSGLFELPVEGAALLTGRDPAQVQQLIAPFRFLGLLFQLQDDVLDLFGDKGRDAPGNDLREGKISALVVEHVALHPHDRDWLIGILARDRGDTSDADVALVIDRFRTGGALAQVIAQIHQHHALAMEAMDGCGETELGVLLASLAQLCLRPIAHVMG